jgi:hypothetical protein
LHTMGERPVNVTSKKDAKSDLPASSAHVTIRHHLSADSPSSALTSVCLFHRKML